ncbi:EAL domain-containing protein [Clostridium peptidivorans]|uniref:EAL domain-containing protein n=1 Tax=Clostridium peptidivorans TaxID=100174 RepID=UPI000BE3CCE0|nr:EAL domain-containing protein [Clostridium peptidivorans]
MTKHIENHLLISSIIITIFIGAIIMFTVKEHSDIKTMYELNLSNNNKECIYFINQQISYEKLSVQSKGSVIANLLGNSLEDTLTDNTNIISSIFKDKNLLSDTPHNIYFVDDLSGNKINSNGIVKLSYMEHDLRERNWYKDARKSRIPIVSNVYTDIATEKPCITISYSIYKDDKFIGVVGEDILLENIYNLLVKKVYDYDIYLVFSAHNVIISSSGNSIDNNINEIKDKWIGINNNISGYINYKDINNNEIYGCYNNMKDLQCKIFVFTKPTIIGNEKNVSNFRIIAIGSIICLLLLILANYFINRFYNFSDLTGFKTKNKLYTDIIRNAKYCDNASLLIISIKKLSNIKFAYGRNLYEIAINKYAKLIKELFDNRATLYSYSDKSFTLLFKDGNKEELLDFIDKNLSKLEYREFNIKNKSIEIESFLAFIDINKLEMENANDSLFKIEKIVDDLKYGENKYICSSLEILAKDIEIDNNKLILLKEAIKEERLVPFFQPIIDIRTKEVEKYEVLMRIKYGEIYLNPYPFIVIAEKNDLIETVDLIIIEKALYYKSKIDKENKLVFAFNLSVKEIDNINYLRKIDSIVDKYNIKHENIVFEITETENIKDFKKFTSIINECKKNNYRFSIDDFGTGFSSMDYFKKLDVNYLKIDGSFIKEINDKEENSYIVQAIVNMAKAFKVKTVAEFVEDKEILDTIEKLGVDFSQGYYTGRPDININVTEEI